MACYQRPVRPCRVPATPRPRRRRAAFGALFCPRRRFVLPALQRGRTPKMAPAVLKRARAPGGQAVLLNVNVPETRGTVLAVYALFDDLGKGFGPFLVAVRPPLLPGCV